jgi:hypothetical protein
MVAVASGLPDEGGMGATNAALLSPAPMGRPARSHDLPVTAIDVRLKSFVLS